MKLIVGLGNPGVKYALTRHNIGFWAIDRLSENWRIPVLKEKWRGMVGEGRIQEEKVFLLKPLTYMNLSGESVAAAMQWLKLNIEDLVVVYDDLDLPLGRVRLRLQGSAGGHNGMKSIIQHLGTDRFKRVKLGIGRPPGAVSIPHYVLSPFPASERETAEEMVTVACNALEEWLSSDFMQAMNKYNQYLPR